MECIDDHAWPGWCHWNGRKDASLHTDEGTPGEHKYSRDPLDHLSD
mgnify:FL=1